MRPLPPPHPAAFRIYSAHGRWWIDGLGMAAPMPLPLHRTSFADAARIWRQLHAIPRHVDTRLSLRNPPTTPDPQE